LDKVPKAQQEAAKEMVRLIPYAETKQVAEKRKAEFTAWCRQRGYQSAAATLERDWDQLVTFYRFPQEHWKHLRTTNPVESPFAALRLRTDAAKRYKRVDRATALIWKLLMVGEQRFRRLNAPHLLPSVYQGVRFVDGCRKDHSKVEEEVAA
jgi:putative transposase